MKLKPIGVVRSPHLRATGTPIQAALATGVEGTVEVFPEYAPGLRDLGGFERIWLVYWFDRARVAELVVTPYLDTMPRGLFATRAPCRPNPIGISPVRLLEIRGQVLRVADLDILDHTPLLDIKPYVSTFDSFPTVRVGWLGDAIPRQRAADSRFEVSR